MPRRKPPTEIYHALMIVLDDAVIALHDLLDEADSPLPLDRMTWDRVMHVVEEIELTFPYRDFSK